MDTIKLFLNKQDCCGCTACKSICPNGAIEMQPDEEGFLYPKINYEKCIGCKKCINVCPIHRKREENKFVQKGNGIGILNLHVTPNYGANILAYALQSKIQELCPEREVFTIKTDFKPPALSKTQKIKKLIDTQKYFFGKLGFIKYIDRTISSTYTKITKKENPESVKERLKKFDKFRKDYLNLTVPCSCAEDIKNNVPINTFVVGSDIVWNPERAKKPGCFFCKDLTEFKTISYAASISTDDKDILLPLKDVYRENLNYMDMISVREESSMEFIQSLTDKKVYHCCDPAFFLSKQEYRNIAEKSDVKKADLPYIYVYVLDKCPSAIKYAKKLSKRTGLGIYYYCSFHKAPEKNSVFCDTDGPAEFLSRIINAEYVITNSFHCAIFSIIFERKFKVFSREEQNLKLTALLDKLNLSKRYDSVTDIDEPIDWKNTETRINSLKLSSEDYLKCALTE